MAARDVVSRRHAIATGRMGEHAQAIAEHLGIELPDPPRTKAPDAFHLAMFNSEYNEEVLRRIRETVVGPVEEVEPKVKPKVDQTAKDVVVEEINLDDPGDTVDVDEAEGEESKDAPQFDPKEKFGTHTLKYWNRFNDEELADHKEIKDKPMLDELRLKLGRL